MVIGTRKVTAIGVIVQKTKQIGKSIVREVAQHPLKTFQTIFLTFHTFYYFLRWI